MLIGISRTTEGSFLSEYAIIMPSFGERPWASTSFDSIRRYADRHGLDSHCVTDDTFNDLVLDDIRESRGRKNKRAYALKSYLAWKFLKPSEDVPGYSKVLVVDDTCLANPTAPSIFEEYSSAFLAMTPTSRQHARRSHKHIKSLAAKGYLSSVPYDAKSYGNTGVVLYDWTVRHVFSPENLMRHQRLLEASFPHQTTLYWLQQTFEVPLTLLDKTWNSTPSAKLTRDQKRELQDIRESDVDPATKRIMHVTGAFANRKELVESIAAEYSKAV